MVSFTFVSQIQILTNKYKFESINFLSKWIDEFSQKMKFFSCQGIFFREFDFKNQCKNEFQNNNQNNAADSKIVSPLKSILEPIGLTSPSQQPGS